MIEATQAQFKGRGKVKDKFERDSKECRLEAGAHFLDVPKGVRGRI